MESEITNLKEFFYYFDDERICYDYLEKKRWNGNVTCYYCEHTKVYKFSDEKTYKCSSCSKRFTVTKGTIFEYSKIPLSSWFGAIYLYVSHKSGVSAAQIGRHLNISYQSAWFLHHRIMEAFRVDLTDRQPRPGIWEVDEVYIGPNKHKISFSRKRKVKQGTGHIHMTPILGFIRRGEGLFGVVIPDNASRWTVQAIMKQYIDKMGIVMTDGGGIYTGIEKYFWVHEVFIHKYGEFARDKINHSNTIEGCFRHFKDTIRGSYKQLGRKYLQRYWDEFCFRYNYRNSTDIEKFDALFTTINRRITYKQLLNGTVSNIPRDESGSSVIEIPFDYTK